MAQSAFVGTGFATRLIVYPNKDIGKRRNQWNGVNSCRRKRERWTQEQHENQKSNSNGTPFGCFRVVRQLSLTDLGPPTVLMSRRIELSVSFLFFIFDFVWFLFSRMIYQQVRIHTHKHTTYDVVRETSEYCRDTGHTFQWASLYGRLTRRSPNERVAGPRTCRDGPPTHQATYAVCMNL